MGGIVWHTQGSGKSLTMVWLAKWIRENITDARVLIITDRTDRTELDEQIEKVFLGVDEKIIRTKSGADLIDQLNSAENWLLCSLIHKFASRDATGVSFGYVAVSFTTGIYEGHKCFMALKMLLPITIVFLCLRLGIHTWLLNVGVVRRRSYGRHLARNGLALRMVGGT